MSRRQVFFVPGASVFKDARTVKSRLQRLRFVCLFCVQVWLTAGVAHPVRIEYFSYDWTLNDIGLADSSKGSEANSTYLSRNHNRHSGIRRNDGNMYI
ncbi:MAG: hypothetical protein BMS9Abin08_0591 [Gammaproteobacteria bacterium]|nr:MAG: hypothetical protein BMS9Abin08_0591 [Gammaproteobacteria bacterium]